MSDLQRSARGSINQHPCVFGLALDARTAVCGLVTHKDGKPYCSQPFARAHCARIEGWLRDSLRFALHLQDGVRSKAARQRLQDAGLAALGQLLGADTHVVDVQRLLQTLQEKPDGLSGLAAADLVKHCRKAAR